MSDRAVSEGGVLQRFGGYLGFAVYGTIVGTIWWVSFVLLLDPIAAVLSGWPATATAIAMPCVVVIAFHALVMEMNLDAE